MRNNALAISLLTCVLVSCQSTPAADMPQVTIPRPIPTVIHPSPARPVYKPIEPGEDLDGALSEAHTLLREMRDRR